MMNLLILRLAPLCGDTQDEWKTCENIKAMNRDFATLSFPSLPQQHSNFGIL